MKNINKLLILFLTIMATSYVLGNDNATSSSKYLKNFISLHKQFCEKKYTDKSTLEKTLIIAPDLSPTSKFVSVYEIKKQGISYAVSPEKDGCTTDVMIQTKTNSELFSFVDIKKALIQTGYTEIGGSIFLTDVGNDNKKITIIEKKFLSPTGEITTLNYPTEKKDKYYMTLFAKKFNAKKDKVKVKVYLI